MPNRYRMSYVKKMKSYRSVRAIFRALVSDLSRVLNVASHGQLGRNRHFLGYLLQCEQMITGVHCLASQSLALLHSRENMCSRRQDLRCEPNISPLFEANVQYRSAVCQHTDGVAGNLVLAEKQLPSNKGFDQLRLCALKLTLLAERNARPQAAQPHSGVEQTATAHRQPVLIAKATLMIITGGFRRPHASTRT